MQLKWIFKLINKVFKIVFNEFCLGQELRGKLLRGMGEEERTMPSFDSIDPNSIWRRKKHNIVNIGKIDELGR